MYDDCAKNTVKLGWPVNHRVMKHQQSYNTLIQGLTLTAAHLPGATKNFILGSKSRILVAQLGIIFCEGLYLHALCATE